MKITDENSHLFVALKVLEKVGELGKSCAVESYCNGREQGLSISTFREPTYRQVAFSEYRNSDQIVVYSGELADFDMQGNVPSAKTYEQKHFFGCGDYVGAARFISNYLLGKPVKETK